MKHLTTAAALVAAALALALPGLASANPTATCLPTGGSTGGPAVQLVWANYPGGPDVLYVRAWAIEFGGAPYAADTEEFNPPGATRTVDLPGPGVIRVTMNGELAYLGQCAWPLTVVPVPPTPEATPPAPPAPPTPVKPRPKPRPMTCARFRATHPGAPAGAYRRRGWRPNCGVPPPAPRRPVRPDVPVTG